VVNILKRVLKMSCGIVGKFPHMVDRASVPARWLRGFVAGIIPPTIVLASNTHLFSCVL